MWQQHLGRGIVGTSNDFGFQGERPTHPELLDWLAGELIRKRLATEADSQIDHDQQPFTCRIPSTTIRTPKIDPEQSAVLAISRRDRLEAEIIRDSMLAVSGQLDETQFGPGTLDETMRRRSIYFMIKRSKLIPFLQVFDTPEPLASVGERPSTTIAPQALIFMNNPSVREYARSFARRIVGDEKEVDRSRAFVALT